MTAQAGSVLPGDEPVWERTFGTPTLRAVGGTLTVLGCLGLSILWIDPDATLIPDRQIRWSSIGGGPFLIVIGLLLLLGRESCRVDGMTKSVSATIGFGPLVYRRVRPFSDFSLVEVAQTVTRGSNGKLHITFIVRLRGKAELRAMKTGNQELAHLAAERISRITGSRVVERTDDYRQR